MRNWVFTGLAAAVLTAGPLWAQGHGNGGGHGGGNGHGGGAEPAMPGGGNPGRGHGGGGERGNPGRGHGGDGDGGEGRGHGAAMQAAMQPGNGRGQGGEHRDATRGTERGNGPHADETRAEGHSNHGQAMREERVETSHRSEDHSGRGPDAPPGMAARLPPNHVNRSDADGVRLRQVFAAPARGLINGCPPGLAAKNNGCRPPGLARQQDAAWRTALYRPAWWGLSGLDDGNYVYDDGYLYRLGNAGAVGSYIPLLGGALGLGNAWPSYYQPVELPGYYQRYYGLGPRDTYRYADNVIYRVDPTSSAISSIAALLTGDDFAVGQRLPPGYDVYNVPYPYRAQYADTPDAWYRYSDGYVYQVDPKTRLIAAAIELLTS